MRFYGFGNYYLSSLQQGLQAGHCVGDLYALHKGDKLDMVLDWAKNHKTMVLLNGGNSKQLQELFDKFKNFKRRGMNLPFVKFHEDEQSLGGALTYVGIILPEEIYEIKTDLVQTAKNNWQTDLALLTKGYRLAN